MLVEHLKIIDMISHHIHFYALWMPPTINRKEDQGGIELHPSISLIAQDSLIQYI